MRCRGRGISLRPGAGPRGRYGSGRSVCGARAGPRCAPANGRPGGVVTRARGEAPAYAAESSPAEGTMRQWHLRRALLTLASLAGFIGCGGDGGPTSPPGATGLTFASVSAGFEHTCGLTTAGAEHTCGVTAAGAAYCWGYNYDGKLGDGTTTQRLTPVRVASDVRFATVGAGNTHSCGVTDAGVMYCWGFNGVGEVGDGTTTKHLTPVLAAG